MAETLVATPRTGKFNKNHARRVRVAGQIPAVVYGAGQEPVELRQLTAGIDGDLPQLALALFLALRLLFGPPFGLFVVL